MLLMIWNDKFNVGIREFDEYHKSLFMILKKMRIHIKSREPQEQILPLIENLLKKSNLIFKLEEEFMSVCNFHDIEPHCLEHRTFLTRLNEFKDDLLNEDAVSVLQGLDYLIHWLTFHILESDKEYSSYASEFAI